MMIAHEKMHVFGLRLAGVFFLNFPLDLDFTEVNVSIVYIHKCIFSVACLRACQFPSEVLDLIVLPVECLGMQLQAEKAPSQDAETPVEGQPRAYQRGEDVSIPRTNHLRSSLKSTR